MHPELLHSHRLQTPADAIGVAGRIGTDKAEQWMHLDQAVDFAGFNVRLVTNREPARHFLSPEEELTTAVHRACGLTRGNGFRLVPPCP